MTSILASADRLDGECELILVDDCSPTPVERELKQRVKDPRVRYLRHQENRGPAAARNTGVSAARHEVILFTDDDVVVDVAWIERLSRYLSDAPRHIGGVGGRVRALGTDVFSRYFEYHHILDPFRMDDGRVLYLVTACCAYRRSVLLQVGGFDEDVKAPGGEDPGLAFKVAAAGYELHVVDDAVIQHDFRYGLLNFWETFRRYGRGCRHQVVRHWKGFAPPPNTSSQVATYGGKHLDLQSDSSSSNSNGN